MTAFRLALPVVLLIAVAACLPGQQFDPPASKKLDEATRKAIVAKMEQLDKALAELRSTVIKDRFDHFKRKQQIDDVEVYLKAATWVLRHDEFYDKESGAWTLETLDRGLERAAQVKTGRSPWVGQSGRTVIRGLRSVIDGSVQPYAITLPPDFEEKQRAGKYRFDVVLHGRDPGLTEVKFIHGHHDKPAPKNQGYVRIDIYGRGNVAYRWAAEEDVFVVEPLLAAQAAHRVLRGFSMGGAGTWHLGLHHPDKWSILGPGAGFTTTHGYIKGMSEKLPLHQEKCLRIYDAVDYAENAFNVPVVAYSGEKDAQKAAADNIEKRLGDLKIPMTHLIAPGLGHRFPPEWQRKAEAEYARHLAKDHENNPRRIRFVTYTLRYNGAHWMRIEALERHYERSAVDAERTEKGFTVRTENVRALSLYSLTEFAKTLTVNIDGHELKVEPALVSGNPFTNSQGITLERRDSRWRAISSKQLDADRKRRLQKWPGRQGPIDDAFMFPFLCVRGTGEPWHEATQKYATGNLERFRYEWSKFLRGDLPVKDDRDVTAEDIARKHLILFGDPASNSLIAKVLDKLPLKWTKESITFAGKTAPAGEHVAVMIFLNPLNPKNYVVLNSGHTFHAEDFRGTNALLYPRLGDYALLKLTPTAKDPLAVEVVTAGLFDDFWRIK